MLKQVPEETRTLEILKVKEEIRERKLYLQYLEQFSDEDYRKGREAIIKANRKYLQS